MSRFLLLALVAGACGKGGSDPPPSVGSDPAELGAPAPGCAPLPFAGSTPVPEASGAAWLEVDGVPRLVVVGDSGQRGAYGLVDPDTGETTETGTLPLGAAGDDLEGVAGRGDTLFGVTSSGWIRAWRRAGAGFELVGPAYPLGPVDLPDKGGMGDVPPAGTGMVCGARATNCGRNYEGLCLVDPALPPGACVGFVASKADGHLYCLGEQDGKLTVRFEPRIAIARPGVVADCAFADDGTLWVGSNLFDRAHVYRVDGWRDPATAVVTTVAPLGIGFPETLAVRGDVIYRMSDTGGAPSLMTKFRCPR